MPVEHLLVGLTPICRPIKLISKFHGRSVDEYRLLFGTLLGKTFRTRAVSGGLVLAGTHLACNQVSGVRLSYPPPIFKYQRRCTLAKHRGLHLGVASSLLLSPKDRGEADQGDRCASRLG